MISSVEPHAIAFAVEIAWTRGGPLPYFRLSHENMTGDCLDGQCRIFNQSMFVRGFSFPSALLNSFPCKFVTTDMAISEFLPGPIKDLDQTGQLTVGNWIRLSKLNRLANLVIV